MSLPVADFSARIGGLALLPKRRLEVRYIVLAAGGLALSVLDAEVSDEGDRVALGIVDGR
jgi:hypothetical protein